jgi:hypothetical protein
MDAIELRLLFILGLLGLGGLAALTGALLSSLAERLSPSPRISRRRAGARTARRVLLGPSRAQDLRSWFAARRIVRSSAMTSKKYECRLVDPVLMEGQRGGEA